MHLDLTATAVARAREIGLAVWVWTVNTETDLRRVLDRPDEMLRFFESQPGDRP
jgi:hypothetical protein